MSKSHIDYTDFERHGFETRLVQIFIFQTFQKAIIFYTATQVTSLTFSHIRKIYFSYCHGFKFE